MNWQFWEWAILSLMMWREARSEGIEGMRAVGHVAWNRAQKAALSVAVIITQDAQFTSINPPKKSYDSQLDVWPNPGDQSFKDAMKIANEILAGDSADPTNGATFYWQPETSTPNGWYARNIAKSERYAKVATISGHEFHAEVKA